MGTLEDPNIVTIIAYSQYCGVGGLPKLRRSRSKCAVSRAACRATGWNVVM